MTPKAQKLIEKLAANKNEAYVQTFMRAQRQAKKDPEITKVPSQAEYIKKRKEEITRIHEHPVKEVFRGMGRSMAEGAGTLGMVGAIGGAFAGAQAGGAGKMLATAAGLGALGAGAGAAAGGASHLVGGGIAVPIVRHLNKKYVEHPKLMHKTLKEEYHDLKKHAMEAPVERALFRHYSEGGKKPSAKEYVEEGKSMMGQAAKRGRIAQPIAGATMGALTGAAAMMGSESGPAVAAGAAVGGAAGAALGLWGHHKTEKRIMEHANSPQFEASQYAHYENLSKGLSHLYKKKK